MVWRWHCLSLSVEMQVLAEVNDLSIASAFMQLAALQGEYAQLTGTLFAARRNPCSPAPAACLVAWPLPTD